MIFQNTNSSRWLREDYLHMSLRNIFLPLNAIWTMQWSHNLPKMYDGVICRLPRWYHGSIHGWFFRSSFEGYLANLEKVLAICVKVNLVLSWEKCHFIVKEGIVLGHIIYERGIEVEKVKIEVIENLQPWKTVREIRSFLGHAVFYRCFIKDFSKITKPLTGILMKDA